MHVLGLRLKSMKQLQIYVLDWARSKTEGLVEYLFRLLVPYTNEKERDEYPTVLNKNCNIKVIKNRFPHVSTQILAFGFVYTHR
jgi:hypothetical protein